MRYVGYTTVLLMTILFSSTLGGWTLTVLWSWFIVDLFDAPTLSIPSAIGICITVGFFAFSVSQDDNEKEAGEMIKDSVINSILRSVVCLSGGWVAAQFL